MHTENDALEPNGLLAEAGIGVSDEPPAHTVFSVVLMVVLSAGVLVALEWGLSDSRAPLAAWGTDATLFSDSVWHFPDESTFEAMGEVSYLITQSSPGPILTFPVEAAQARQVRAEVAVVHAIDGTPAPFQLEWYWMRSEQLSADDAYPFSKAQAIAFYRPIRHHADRHQVDLSWHDAWTGSIPRMMLGVRLWKGTSGPFRVIVRRVELVE